MPTDPSHVACHARVVNCAALNDRGACDANEAAAAAVNVPAKLLDALDQHIKVRW